MADKRQLGHFARAVRREAAHHAAGRDIAADARHGELLALQRAHRR